MSMCIHGQEFETCRFGCTLKEPEELRLANDKLQAELERHRWIPVEEKLPEKDGPYCTLDLTEISRPDIRIFWFTDNSFYGRTTHWMPIILPAQTP